MSFSFGNRLRMHVFGESHGDMIGVSVEGFPPGLTVDKELIQQELDKRRPGVSRFVTPRKEKDRVKIISGMLEGKSTGAPITMIIENEDVISKDYDVFRKTPRPGHADLPAMARYGGFHDIRGSGIFSGRMTAAFVMAGALARHLLEIRNIDVFAHIIQIGRVVAKEKSSLEEDYKIKCLDPLAAAQMEKEIAKAMEEGDSVGSMIECVIDNMPMGVGEPMFDSIESIISHGMYSIPAVKAISFGTGPELAGMRGSEANDEYYMKEGKVISLTNNNGGVLGGMSNGMPIIFQVTIKPTPSISKSQRTIDISEGVNRELKIKGRHDPCIGIRAVTVVENMAAFCIADLILRYDHERTK